MFDDDTVYEAVTDANGKIRLVPVDTKKESEI